MKAHFCELSLYNAWANRRLYSDALSLAPGLAQRNVGVYFGNLLATLQHVLQTDRAWIFILQGGALGTMVIPPAPEELSVLKAVRMAQDEQIIAWIEAQDEAWFDQPFAFVSGLGGLKGMTYQGSNASALAHVFNHQSHHRGQAHAALTVLGLAEPKPLDILIKGFLRE